MINKLIEWCLKNRFVVLVFTGVVIVWGIYAINRVPVDAIPDIGENQQIIFVDWPGRDAQTIEDQITYPLTTRLFGIPGVKTVRASSAFGFSMVYVIFNDRVDFYWGRSRILEKLQQAQQFLPQGVIPVLGPDATGLGQVYWYTVEGEGYSLQELRSLQDWYIRYQLNSVEGVSEVASVGGFVKQYQIDIDPNKLLIYGVQLGEVFNAVRNSNIDVGAKVVEKGGMEFIVRGVGFIKKIEDIDNIVVGSYKGTPVYVKNIATVQLGPEFRRGVLDKAGREAVGGVVIVRYKENPLAVIIRVKQRIKELELGLPQGVKIVPFYDRTELIKNTINTLRDTLILEIIITIIVVFFFLRHFMSNLIVSFTLPLAVLVSFIVMYYLKVDSNIMSLSGIAIAIGTLVDMGIIIVENSYRHLVLDGGKRPRLEVIFEAAKEVGSAVITAILTTVVSFFPVFALESQEGKLFGPLAYTKTFALLAAVFIALTLTPVLCYYLLKGRLLPVEENPAGRVLVKYYEKILRWVLANRKKFLLIPAAVLAVSLFIATRIGREFMPPFDEGTILFMPVVSPSVSLTEAQRIMQIQNRIIKAFPEVDSVVGKSGRAETATDPAPVEMFETIINLKPKSKWRKGVTKEKLIHDMDAALKFPGVANIWTQPIVNRIDMLATGIRTPVGVKIFGSDLKELERIADEIKRIVQGVKGAEDLYAERITGKPYLEIIPDRQQIARYNLTMRDVQDVIEMAIGGENLTTTVEGRERYPVRVRYLRELRDSPEKIRRVLVPTPAGNQVPLGQVAEIRLTEGPAMISSENGMLRAYVLMNVRGRDMVGFVEEASKIVAEKIAGKLPAGYSIQWSGQFENQVRAKKKLSVLVPISLFINYMIIFMCFKSHRKSLTIFAAIPVSLSGGILLLAIYGYNFSVAVWVGFIALFGIAVDDGVLITTYLDQVFTERKPKTKQEVIEATVHAGKARIRPAFMTSVTTILALLPIFIFGGTGIEIIRPMAIPSFGGMTLAAITWFIIPTIYSWFEERKINKAS
ncbi:MAG: CusA/CzcA family heavy metal efflux RND transporter [Elusimicrobia bacterium]|nr:CusA/CzcA family heavy metal efflux RND transporter [Elusimicrobiota bacterium]